MTKDRRKFFLTSITLVPAICGYHNTIKVMAKSTDFSEKEEDDDDDNDDDDDDDSELGDVDMNRSL